jgi:hypothetical protein
MARMACAVSVRSLYSTRCVHRVHNRPGAAGSAEAERRPHRDAEGRGAAARRHARQGRNDPEAEGTCWREAYMLRAQPSAGGAET